MGHPGTGKPAVTDAMARPAPPSWPPSIAARAPPQRPRRPPRHPGSWPKPRVAALEPLLAGAQGGEGLIALVSGEPGIGKTRLALEVAHQAGRWTGQ
jgi:hypothetical protein